MIASFPAFLGKLILDPRAGRWSSLNQAAASTSTSRSFLLELVESGRLRSACAFGHTMVDHDELSRLLKCSHGLVTLGKPGDPGLPPASA